LLLSALGGSTVDRELIVAVPGPWKDRSEFLGQIISSTDGKFMLMGPMLAIPAERDNIMVEFCDPDPNLRRAFQVAGRGQLNGPTIGAIARHQSVVYAHFPLQVLGQQARILRYTNVLRQIGGIAVKIESAGIAHQWDAWESMLRSEDLFDLYTGFVNLIAGDDHYYSCGMHQFDLPDARVPRSLPDDEAAHLMNQFNYYRLSESPAFEEGHTFSLAEQSPRFKLSRVDDVRYAEDHPYHNAQGLWDLR
jgi:hypothetical protein